MNYKSILFIAILIPLTACKGQKKCDELYKFIFTNTAQKNVYYEIHLMGKDAIPCLIEFMDTDKKSVVGYKDPYSSIIEPFVFNNYIGIKAGYLIEFIIAKDSVENVSVDVWKDKLNPYRLFEYCVIVKTENNKPILEPLDYIDMKVLKEIYLKWWQLNKDKPIELLRKEWKENKHILDNTPYKWI